jgi:hypothetical protein
VSTGETCFAPTGAAVALANSQSLAGTGTRGSVSFSRNVRVAAYRYRQHTVLVGDKLLAHAAAQKLAVPARLRQEGDHVAAGINQIPLPARRNHRVALLVEKTVAGGVCFGKVAAAVVQSSERAAPPAIGKIEKQLAVAAAQVDRLHDIQNSFEFDQPFGIARRKLQVADERQIFFVGIDGERDGAKQALVGAGIAERDAAGER